MRSSKENDQGVRILSRLLYDADIDLEHISQLIVRVVDDEMWRERQLAETGQTVTFDSFEDFVTAPPLEGLGTTIESLKKLCKGDNRALDAIDRALAHSRGSSTLDEFRSLRENNPEIHKRVLAGEITLNAGMLEAGLRERRLAYYPDDSERTAGLLLRNMEQDAIRELIQHLQAGVDSQDD